MLEASHMYRSSLTLAFVVLYSAAAAASDLSSVYVAPGGDFHLEVEGSTSLLRSLGRDRYGEVLATHNRLLRAAFTDAGGKTSHTAILAQARGIPAVLGLHDLIGHVREALLKGPRKAQAEAA